MYGHRVVVTGMGVLGPIGNSVEDHWRNLVAGASHIRFRHFLIGTLIGELPGLLAISVFVDQIGEAIRNRDGVGSPLRISERFFARLLHVGRKLRRVPRLAEERNGLDFRRERLLRVRYLRRTRWRR